MRLQEICICEQCKKEFLKDCSEIKRNAKLNRRNFCSISCAMTYANSHNVTEAKLKVRKNFIKNFTNLTGDKNPSIKRLDEFSPFRETFRRAKRHAKDGKNKKEFTITLQDLKNQWELQKGRCAITNVKLTLPYSNKPVPTLTE